MYIDLSLSELNFFYHGKYFHIVPYSKWTYPHTKDKLPETDSKCNKFRKSVISGRDRFYKINL